ncbi:ATP-dependent nuclease [Candidatus Nitrospira salsa]
MRISRIQIKHFRSIESADITLSEFNVFVGQNNHGKTNLFEAVEWFYTGSGDHNHIVYRRDAKLDFSVELEISGVQSGLETVKNEKNRSSLRKLADERDSIRVIRKKSNSSKRLIWDDSKNEWSQKNFAGFDKAFNDCIPRLEYVATTTKPGDVAKWGKKTPIGLMLAGVLSTILEKSEKYKEFRKKFDEVFGTAGSDIRTQLDELSGRVKLHLEQQFPDCTNVSFDVSEPLFDDLLKNFETTINDGVETIAEEKGDGMQRALMLAIIKTFSDYRREHEELGKTFIFLIDEAELHLHPTAQRQLKNALMVLAENGDQILINTHSSVLVTDDHEKQSLFRVNKKDMATCIELIGAHEKPQIVYELLGNSPADLLFPNNFLIVEGRSEFEFLSRIICRHYTDKPRLQIIIASGDNTQQERSMNAINIVFTPLYQTPVYKQRLVLLCDKPHSTKEEDFLKFRQAYPSIKDEEQFFVLDTHSLEESYPTPWRKTAHVVRSMESKDKVDLAKCVGDTIHQEQFEQEIPIVFKALQKAWEKAHC